LCLRGKPLFEVLKIYEISEIDCFFVVNGRPFTLIISI
jgi:hypothetical protein